jgi:hypothetical protein
MGMNILDVSNIYNLRSMPSDGGLIERCSRKIFLPSAFDRVLSCRRADMESDWRDQGAIEFGKVRGLEAEIIALRVR